jgi:uncharacterized membrane protein YgcG
VLSIHKGRIQVILWLSHLMSPCVQLLASIILYQVSGTDATFALLWCFLWFGPMFAVAYVGRIDPKHKHPATRSGGGGGGGGGHGNALLGGVESAGGGSIQSADTTDSGSADGRGPRHGHDSTVRAQPTSAADRHFNRPWFVVGCYLLYNVGFLFGILKCLTDIFPSGSEIVFMAMQTAVCTCITFLLAYLSLNAEYQTDKQFLRNAATTKLVGFESSSGGGSSGGGSDSIYEGDDAGRADATTDIEWQQRRSHREACGDGGGGELLAAEVTRAAAHEASPFQHMWAVLWAYLSEAREQRQPELFGKRLPWRRIFLLVSIVSSGIFIFHKYKKDSQTDALTEVKRALHDFDPDLIWPANGTVFDNLFEIYTEVRHDADVMTVMAWVVLMVTLLVETRLPFHYGLRASQVGCALSMLCMWLGMVLPAGDCFFSKRLVFLVMHRVQLEVPL